MLKAKNRLKLSLSLFLVLFTFHLLALATPFPPFTAPEALAQDDATPSVRDLVREKVKEKLDTLVRKSQAVVGTISQITDHTIEVKTMLDNKTTAFVATSEETKFFSITKGKRKEIKFEDLALNQNILAMGSKNEKGVLEAKRLIVSDVPTLENKKQVAGGGVTVLGKNTLTVKNKKGEERSLKVNSKTKITGKEIDGKVTDITFADIKIGDGIVGIGIPDDTGVLVATRIHVIPGLSKGVDPVRGSL